MKATKDVPPVSLVRGSQALMADDFISAISNRFLQNARENSDSFRVFYSDETPVAEVIGDARNLSIFSSRKVIVLRRAELLDKQSVGLIAQYASCPASHVCLVLVSQSLTKPNFKPGDGVFIAQAEEKSGKIHKRIIDEARESGLKMSVAAAVSLCALVGEDLNVLRGEIAKIAEANKEGALIDEAKIVAMFERRRSRDEFELSNAVLGGEKEKALEVLAEIAAENRIEPLFILSIISSAMRRVIRASSLLSKMKEESAEIQKKRIADELGVKTGAAHFIWKQARGFGGFEGSDKEKIMRIFADTDLALKTSGSGNYDALFRMIISLFAQRRQSLALYPRKRAAVESD